MKGISADILQKVADDWCKSKEGQGYLNEQGYLVGYTTAQAKAIAEELRDAVVNAYLAQVKDPEKYFDMSTITVGELKETRKGSGKYKIRITFNGAGLIRQSFMHPRFSGGHDLLYHNKLRYKGRSASETRNLSSDYSGTFTGSGVYDIIGLFVNGYAASKRVYGYWWDNRGGEQRTWIIPSKQRRQGVSFVKNTIDSFKRKYPNIDVRYPKEWGGNG